MANARQSRSPWRSADYLSYVRSRPCVVTDRCGPMVVAHHVRLLGGGGTSQKPPDYLCVPLTAEEHDTLHRVGEKSYWRARGQDPVLAVAQTMLVYLALTADEDLVRVLGGVISCR